MLNVLIEFWSIDLIGFSIDILCLIDFLLIGFSVSKSLVAEAQSWGRLGQTLKALLRYDEGIVCCQQQLRIAKEIGDKVSHVCEI